MDIESKAHKLLRLNDIGQLPYNGTIHDFVGEYGADSLQRFILNILADRDNLEELSGRSSMHLNGFLKLVLLPTHSARRFAVRLHSWESTDASEGADPHNHRWPYTSLVLTGSVEETEYVPAEDHREGVLEATKLSFTSNINQSTVSFQTTGTAVLRSLIPAQLGPGASVTAPPRRIHIVRASDQETSTLVVTGSASSPSSTVYRISSQRVSVHSHVYTQRPSIRTLRRCLERSAEALGELT